MSNIAIIGGAGRIGLVLATKFAEKNSVFILDNSFDRVNSLISGKVPFYEKDLQEKFDKVKNNIGFIFRYDDLFLYDYVFVTIGTPIDEYLNPKFDLIYDLFNEILKYKNESDVTFILCSTVYPGTTENLIKKYALNIVYCPERMATGEMVNEFESLKQIISGEKSQVEKVSMFFNSNGIGVKKLYSSVQGELCKLFTNAYRYIHFAIANEFYMMCENFDVNFEDIYSAITENYHRMNNFPKPGFTGGYCLRKDTLQLAAHNGNFQLGYCASVINEKVPLYVFRIIKKHFSNEIKDKTVGILGMAFKGGTDDKRDSLAYRVRKIFANEVKEVLCSDEFIKSKGFVTKEELIERSDIIVICANHKGYDNIDVKGKFVFKF